MNLLLLHGAIGSSEQLLPLRDALGPEHSLYTLDFSGHAGKRLNGSAFSIELFARETLAFLDQNNIDKINIFGYSMGGYVALYLAKRHPERVNKIVTLATKFHWDEATSAKEVQMLNPEKISQKLPAFAETLRLRHAPNDWQRVLRLTGEMMLTMGADNPLKTEDLATVATPTLVMLGDRDKMVTLDETVSAYRALPNAQLCVLPNTPHPIEQVDARQVVQIIERFLAS